MKLRARKALTYATRRLQPGDIFDARGRDARLLLAVRKAEAVREPVELAPPPAAVAAKIADAVSPDARAALRAEYEQALGKRPFHGWSDDELREKIAAAKAGPASA